MARLNNDKDQVKIRSREEDLNREWAGKTKNMPVNNQQFSFDSISRQKDFINSMFEGKDKLKSYYRYRSEWYRRAKEFDPGEAPLAVCCELVSYCNLNCPMCYTITEEFQSSVVGEQRMLPWNIVKNVIDECAGLGVPSMLFSWRGEPTIYSSKDKKGNVVRFPDVLSYARRKGILEVSALSNGQLMDRDLIEAIVDAAPSWISFSIDGLEANYNKIRAPRVKQGKGYNSFGQVVSNIKSLVSYRDSKGKNVPQVRSNTIFPPIANNPHAYYKFMKNIGVGWVTVNELLDFRGDKLPDEAILEDWSCQYPFQRLTVSTNGCILPCTGAHNEEEELILGRYPGTRPKETIRAGKKRIANYSVMNLKEAWCCDAMSKIRDLHKRGRRKKIKACRYCRHGAVKHGPDWVPEDWDMKEMKWRGSTWRE